MLRLVAVLFAAVLLTAQAPIPKVRLSQPPSPSAWKKGGCIEAPTAASQNTCTDQRRGANQLPLVIKTFNTPETQDEANTDANYQQQRSADKHVIEIGIAAIVFGALQTLALFITFWIMRGSAIRQLRAYIFVEKAEFIRNPGGTDPWEVHLIIKNFGATPAIKVVIKVQRAIKKGIGRDAVLPLSADVQARPPVSIAPGHFITVASPLLPANFDFTGSRNAGNKAYLWGTVDYSDAFKRKHSFHFQMVNALDDTSSFGFCDAGNIPEAN